LKYRCVNSDDILKYKQGNIYTFKKNLDVYRMFHENWYDIVELRCVIPEKYIKRDFRSIKEDRKIKLNLL
jgi:hypothetical protein